ncbi:O-acetyltransferase OatA [Roseimaritima multifibrata]|uniref:O-acetyltransferase OatA n=1 Tax=Roseimaritima multifibrata TaxID=1930274 RepID=A0A517MJ11_9BACT|nr:acyltransferase family protein [Roseimaritima multifibrata]QDS94889.1 O-acetyltransferase OatA [Roseimaritima multifibrata]
MAGIGYRPEIDGLRAFAVIPVILFHLGLSWIPGGYIGVDVFFVISGFLITSIIKRELDQGTFSFRDFWARRIRRILPAMTFVTAVTLAVSYVFVFRPDQQAIGQQGIAALLSFANIYFWQSIGDYWGTAAEESPFLHAWSLSLEEQFYLFFPLAMWLIFRLRSRWIQGCILTATIGSLVLFLGGLHDYPNATFYLLPTRVWELGTGCLLAVSLNKQSPKNSNFGIFAVAGLGMVVTSYFFIDKLNGGLGLAVVGTALIIAFGQTGLCNVLLSQRSVVHIGKISYSLYLWHWPILVLAPHLGFGWLGPFERIVLVVGTYFFALGTYHFVEKPTRRRRETVPVVLAASMLLVVIASMMATTLRLYDTSNFAEARWVTYDVDPRPGSILPSTLACKTVHVRPGNTSDAYYTGGVGVRGKSEDPEIIVLGDSHGVMWSDAIVSVAREEGISTRCFAMGGVSAFFHIPPTLGKSTRQLSKEELLRYSEARLAYIEKWNPRLVIIADWWGKRAEQSQSHALLAILKAQGTRVLLIEDPPTLLDVHNQNVMQLLAAKGVEPQDGIQHFMPYSLEKDDVGRKLVRELAASYDHVEYLPTYDLYAHDAGALVLDGKQVFYLDEHHLLQAGAQMIKPRLRDKILEILAD